MESEFRRMPPQENSRQEVRSKPQIPALLVSVRDAVEAAAALKGGCDILDVKEPGRGPLGMADEAAIRAILAAHRAMASTVPVSLALGELQDWSKTSLIPRLGSAISFLKFGTSRLRGHDDLRQRISAFRARFAAQSGVDDKRRKGTCGWIAVAYADWQAAEAPHPCEVAHAAVESDCDGLLIDTFCKAAGGLFESLSELELRECAAIVRRAGRTFALAGRLGLGNLERALPFGPDILGIRSAACRNGRRDLEVDRHAVETFRQAMRHSGSSPFPGGN